MFCPNCRTEYREGFTECSDCRVALVAELSEGQAETAANDTVVVLVTQDPALLDEAMNLLDGAGIACALESGGAVIPDGEAIDLGQGAVAVRVAPAAAGPAGDCLREALERYSLSAEGLVALQQETEDQMDAFDPGESGALVAAIEAGAAAAIDKLLKAGVDVNQPNDAGRTALIAASAVGDELTIEELLAAGADVLALDPDGFSALHFAAHAGRAPALTLLLGKGADANTQAQDGSSPLMTAAEHGRLACVGLLLASGADPNARDGNGETPSTLALHMGYEQVGTLLDYKTRLDSGLRADMLDDDGRDALLIAAAEGRIDLASALIDVGADLDATDSQGRTALIWAAVEARADLLQALIERGARVDAPDKEGCTALSWAAENGHAEIVHALLEHGADPKRQDAHGWTPLQFAQDNEHRQVVKILREAASAP